MNYHIISDLIIFSGAFFSFILALAQLLLRERNIHNLMLALLFFSYSLFQVSNSFTLFYASREWYHWYQIMYPLGLTFLFFIGPLQFTYFRSIIEPGRKVPPLFVFHFLPGIVFLCIMVLFHPGAPNYFIAPEDYLKYLRKENFVYVITSLVSVLFFAAYIVVFLKQVSVLYAKNSADVKIIHRTTLIFSVLIIMGLLLWFLYFIGVTGILKIVHVLMTFYLVAIYLLSNRYPQFIHIIKLEAERESYMQSQVKNIDAEAVIEKLNHLMSEEKLYRSEEINLKITADRLGVTSHQLSEILNSMLGKSFFFFVNEFRIGEAKKNLIDNPEEQILSIAYRVGFNSSSSFYESFKKFTGVSPSAFRKKIT